MWKLVVKSAILFVVSMVSLGCGGGHSHSGSADGKAGHSSAGSQNGNGSSNGRGDGPGPPGSDNQAEAPGAPYEVLDDVPLINGFDMRDDQQWPDIQKFYLSKCPPGNSNCVNLVRSYTASVGPAGDCKLAGSSPGPHSHIALGTTVVLLGTQCPEVAGPTDTPSSQPTDTENPQPGDSQNPDVSAPPSGQ